MVQLFFSNMNDAKEVERRTGAEFVHHKIRLMQAKDLHLSETFEEASQQDERLEAVLLVYLRTLVHKGAQAKAGHGGDLDVWESLDY